MRTLGAGAFSGAFDESAEEMHAGVGACRVDVVVPGEVTHVDECRLRCRERRYDGRSYIFVRQHGG